MGKRAVNPRSQSKRERFRQQVLEDHGPTCRMPRCLMPTRAIDLNAKHNTPGEYTADHIVELCVLIDQGRPESAYYDRTNGRPAHRRCNSHAGASTGGRRLAAQKRRQPRPRRLGYAEGYRNPAY